MPAQRVYTRWFCKGCAEVKIICCESSSVLTVLVLCMRIYSDFYLFWNVEDH